MKFVIVTGLSGSGKSEAMRALEDMGFYCVDNLPPALITKFAELCYCLLYTSPSPRDGLLSRMPSSA